MYGASTGQNFTAYQEIFINSMTSFKRLSDPAYIDRQPTRIRIREVSSSQSLENALRSFGTSRERLEELAVLNGMELEEEVPAGVLIKTLSTD